MTKTIAQKIAVTVAIFVVFLAVAPSFAFAQYDGEELGGGGGSIKDDGGWITDYYTYGGGGESPWTTDYYTYGGGSDPWVTDYYTYDSGCGYSCGGSYGGGSSYYPSYSSGCGYFCGGSSYGGGGGYYTVTPRISGPTGGGSQNQNQTQNQTQVSNNENTNTNVNVNNNTAIAVAQVQIGSQQAPTPTYPTYPTYQAPYCSINQAQSYGYSYGTNPVYLSWTSSNAQHAYLSNYGSVGVSGSQTVYPTYTTTYTLTVYGYNGQQATCQTTVYANNYIPTTPYVSLTQIPYTGFDFGPVGNAMYWAGLVVFALGGAYLAVYFIPGLIGGRQAFAGSFSNRTYAPVVAPKAPVLLEKEASEANVAPIVAALRKNGTTDSMAIVQVKGSMPKIIVDRS